MVSYRKGRIVAIGTVTGDYRYDEKNQGKIFAHKRSVEWKVYDPPCGNISKNLHNHLRRPSVTLREVRELSLVKEVNDLYFLTGASIKTPE